MNLLSLEHISKSYGVKKTLDDVSFFLQEGEKVGIIGINGTGKTTLLRIVAGVEEPDAGNVTLASHVVIRFLSQHPVFDNKKTVLESVLADCARQSNGKDGNELSWTLEAKAKEMLMRFGIYDMNEEVGHLSGGQRKRLALVAVLLADSDILILDEPTNHLDENMSAWLEDYLKNTKKALIMVTHDRYFLDSVTNRIVEISKGNLYSYQANYSEYLRLKQERIMMENASERKRQSILRKEIAWMQRGARARSTKQKAHIQRYEELVAIEGPTREEQVYLSSAYSRLGKTTIELTDISKRYGEKTLINNFSYIFLKDDRVGFVGANGCGKTTLMKMIEGSLMPDSGKIERGQTVKIGYYAQEIGTDIMNPRDRVIDYIRDVAEYVETADGKLSASAMLERFLFEGEVQYGLLGKLSGGEKRRLYLCRVLMEAPNVLILDEPTNDLDIATLQILEDYLDSFAGIVIVVSHDRYFLDRVVRRIFAFEDGKLTQYEGGYSDYAAKRSNGITQNGSNPKKNEKDESYKNSYKIRQKKIKFSFAEQREYETIEEEIAKLEALLLELEQEEMKNATNSVKLNELASKRAETEEKLEERMQRWMYLEELAMKIEEQG